MADNILPLSNVINVTITQTPSGLSEKNVNSLLLLTNEMPNSIEPYTINFGASQVASEYGTNSLTAAMANAVFSQSPNLLTGGGRLIVAPMIAAVSATEGTCTTADITANLSDILLVTNGDLNVDIDGVGYDLTGLNFAGANDFDDVATIIGRAIGYCDIEATATGLKFTSKKVGADSDIVIGVVAGGTGTDLAGAGYLNALTSTSVSGVDSSGETIEAAVSRLDPQVGFVGIMTSIDLEDDAISSIASFTQARDNIFFHHVSSPTDIAGIGTTIADATLTRTRLLMHTTGQATANLMKAAYAGRGCSVNFRGNKTSQTMNLKSLTGISPDYGISQTMYTNSAETAIDLYVSYRGLPNVVSNGGNDYFDNIYGDLALKFFLEVAGFNYLRQTNTKVPQTEDGMNGLKAAYGGVCEIFVRNGSIAGGSWNSSERFGDPEIFDENVLNNGYYIYSLPVTQQDSIERENRTAPLVQIAIKRAGAIHKSSVLVVVND